MPSTQPCRRRTNITILSSILIVSWGASAWGICADRSVYRFFPLESCACCPLLMGELRRVGDVTTKYIEKDQTTGDKSRCPKREFHRCIYCSRPWRTDFLDERHKFKETNGIFNVTKGIRNTFGKGNATAKQAIDVKLSRQGIELDSKGFTIHRYTRNRNRLVANGVDNGIATRHLLGIKLLLVRGLSGELETLDIRQCRVRLLGPVRGQPLQSSIVIQDPVVLVLREFEIRSIKM